MEFDSTGRIRGRIHPGRAFTAVGAVLVLLTAVAVMAIAAPRASADPTYQRTQETSCTADPDVGDADWWPNVTVRADATVQGQVDGSERIVAVGNFRFEEDRWDLWVVEAWTSTPEAIAHTIDESGGKHAGWFAGGRIRSEDTSSTFTCAGDVWIA